MFQGKLVLFGLLTLTASVAHAQMGFENPFYIACEEQARNSPETQHTVEVLIHVALSRASTSSSDRNLAERGQLSCTRILTLLGHIHALNLSGKGIQDLTPVAGLWKLEVLDISNNNVTDISPMARLGRLRALLASNNKIDDISALNTLPSLEFLDLRNNSIEDILPLADLETLIRLDVRGNPVRDFVLLQNALTTLRIVGP